MYYTCIARCKAKSEYLLICKVGRYCLLILHGSILTDVLLLSEHGQYGMAASKQDILSIRWLNVGPPSATLYQY